MVRCTIKTTSRSNIFKYKNSRNTGDYLEHIIKKDCHRNSTGSISIFIKRMRSRSISFKNGAVVNANATATAALNDKSSFEEKAAYAIGASLGEYVAQMKQSQEQLIGPISAEKVIEGFTDGVNGASALDRAQIEKY